MLQGVRKSLVEAGATAASFTQVYVPAGFTSGESETGRLSLAQIAAACGFTDQSHLTRHYKRMLGVTPGRVRRRTLSNSRSAGRLYGSRGRSAAFE